MFAWLEKQYNDFRWWNLLKINCIIKVLLKSTVKKDPVFIFEIKFRHCGSLCQTLLNCSAVIDIIIMAWKLDLSQSVCFSFPGLLCNNPDFDMNNQLNLWAVIGQLLAREENTFTWLVTDSYNSINLFVNPSSQKTEKIFNKLLTQKSIWKNILSCLLLQLVRVSPPSAVWLTSNYWRPTIE